MRLLHSLPCPSPLRSRTLVQLLNKQDEIMPHYHNSQYIIQYKVTLLKLLHWRGIYVRFFDTQGKPRERHMAGWLRTFAFLEQWCLKQLLPPEPFVIHLPGYILVVRVCYGWQLTERNEERSVERKSQTAHLQHCFQSATSLKHFLHWKGPNLPSTATSS